MDERRRLRGKKLLVATLGLASATLTGCGSTTSGNLIAPPEDAGVDAPAERSDGGAPDSGAESDAGSESDGSSAPDGASGS